jgi:HPr kinase/phosphorylase
MKPFNVHATCVSLGGHGVLIRGKPGSGKSELALRLMDAPGYGAGDRLLRAQLVADDQTMLVVIGQELVASPPAAIAGLLELRGQGILNVPHVASTPVRLVVDLIPGEDIERMPEERHLQTEIAGITLPRIALDRAQPAAPAIIRGIFTSRLKLLPDGPQTA